jgi:hypothetical protein
VYVAAQHDIPPHVELTFDYGKHYCRTWLMADEIPPPPPAPTHADGAAGAGALGSAPDASSVGGASGNSAAHDAMAGGSSLFKVPPQMGDRIEVYWPGDEEW